MSLHPPSHLTHCTRVQGKVTISEAAVEETLSAKMHTVDRYGVMKYEPSVHKDLRPWVRKAANRHLCHEAHLKECLSKGEFAAKMLDIVRAGFDERAFFRFNMENCHFWIPNETRVVISFVLFSEGCL